MSETAAIAIVGDGQLARFVGEMLEERFSVVRCTDFGSLTPLSVQLILALYDDWRPSDFEQAERALRQIGIPWLRAAVLYDEGVVGPLVRPGVPGCSMCADLRSFAAGRDRESSLELQMSLLLHGVVTRASSVSTFGIWHTGWIAAAEACKIVNGENTLTNGGLYFVDLRTLASSPHAFLPDPLCPHCGSLPDDTAEAAVIELQPRPKIDSDTYRSGRLADIGKAAAADYRDERTGLLNKKMPDLLSPFADVYMNLSSPTGDEAVAGRSHVYRNSEWTAMLEGLERYCGMAPRGKKTAIRDTCRNLSDLALDPLRTGAYSAAQYAEPDFPYAPFDPDLPINWVWGYSFMQERPILVPEQLAYYSQSYGDGIFMEGSNGCALGSSREEAIFHGLMETVERDAFLLSWYARLPLPRIDPDRSGDKQFQLMVDRLRHVSGYELLLFNTTMETGIPSVWAIAKNRGSTGANLLCAGGAHPDPLQAAKSAVMEVAGNIAYVGKMLDDNRESARLMLNDPNLVSRMTDHALLYALPEAEIRLHFLLNEDRPLETFQQSYGLRDKFADLADELRHILQRFIRLQLDVIVVDQTAPEAVRNGLHCVKVLVPGLLPMSYGHRFVRLTGLERVLNLPHALGYSDRPLTLEALNPHPHPFL